MSETDVRSNPFPPPVLTESLVRGVIADCPRRDRPNVELSNFFISLQHVATHLTFAAQ